MGRCKGKRCGMLIQKKSPTDSPVPMGDEGNGMGELKAHLIGILMQTWCQGMKDKGSYYRWFAIQAWRSLRSSAEISENWTPIPEPEVLSFIVATVFQMILADTISD